MLNTKAKFPNIVKRIKLKRQTKLICTIDDKWNNYENISKLLSLGVDALEIYSELKEDVKREIIAKVKTYAKENNQYIPILYNISYYRIYISQINKNDENEAQINQNQIVYIVNNKKSIDLVETKLLNKYTDNVNINIENNLSETTENNEDFKSKKSENLDEISIEDKNIFLIAEPFINCKNLATTDIIHINYGEISLKVDSSDENFIKCVSLNTGTIQKYNSLSVEGKEHFSNDLVYNDKNKLHSEIESAVELGAEFLVISVIKDPVNEIKEVREISKLKIVVKIDNSKSIQSLDDYLEFTDAIYFSRSDLNLKDSLSKICFYQKSVVSKCGYVGVPVIIAGTFLDTMRTLPNPIRAEISDLYNTVLQGIDCLLLTSEIIFGNYPYEVVETINEICASCEKRVDYSNLFLEILYKTQKPMKIVEAVASSTVKTSFNLQTPFIVCVTEKGTASQMVAKYRPYCPVISITSKTSIAHSLALLRGIFSMIYEDTYNTDAVITHANDFLIKSKLIAPKSNIVLLSGLNEKKNGTTDQMRVIEIM